MARQGVSWCGCWRRRRADGRVAVAVVEKVVGTAACSAGGCVAARGTVCLARGAGIGFGRDVGEEAGAAVVALDAVAVLEEVVGAACSAGGCVAACDAVCPARGAGVGIGRGVGKEAGAAVAARDAVAVLEKVVGAAGGAGGRVAARVAVGFARLLLA